MKKIILSCFLGLILFWILGVELTSAQVLDPPLRVEIELEKDSYPIHLISMKEQGILILREKALDHKEEYQIQFITYDTNLMPQNEFNYNIDINYEYKTSLYHNQSVYVVFQPSSARKENDNVLILKYTIGQAVEVQKYTGLGDLQVYDIQKLGSGLLLSMALSMEQEKLAYIDTDHQRLN